MFGFALTTLITALSLLIVDLAVPGVTIATFPAALLAGVSIGFVNAVVKPVLSVLSLPVNFVTFGLFSLVVNGICFWLASVFVPGFAVHGLLALILAPVVLSFASTFLNSYFIERGFGQPLADQKADVMLESGSK
ncbi:MAG: phage holin family protein [Tildeniella nuda ZEHNDER 1965/U140]|jgi:putative membrane protein|nr:phage holin family protein [Tildeniella nuda ZEHNDER 1965/U140]